MPIGFLMGPTLVDVPLAALSFRLPTMLIRFQFECGKKLKAAAGQAGSRGQCSTCGRTITVPKASTRTAAAQAVVPEHPWYFSRRDRLCGPLSWEALQETAAAGGLGPDDLLLPPRATDWVAARQVPDLLPASAPDVGGAPAPMPALGPAAGETPFESRHEVLAEAQVVPDPTRCVQCGICSFNCPMAIDVRAHARRGRPIHDSRCLTCSQCVTRCPRGVLRFERLDVLSLEFVAPAGTGAMKAVPP